MSPRPGLVNGRVGSAYRWGLVAASLVMLLLVAACDGGSTGTEPTGSSPPSTSNTSNASTSTEPPTSSRPTSTTTAIDETAGVKAAWDGFWEAWATVRASEDLDPAPLEGVAAPNVVDGAVTLFERQRESGLGAVETEWVTHPTVTIGGTSEAVIEDCVLVNPSFTDAAGVWYEADMVQEGQDWIVADLRINTTSGCVPEELAAAAIAAYEAYYDAEAEFWDPPDPGHPLLVEVLAEPRLSNVIGLLREHEARGVALRGQPTTHPEVIEVRSPTEVVIRDCYEPDPDYGVYDLETGERLADEPEVQEGQRNLRSAVMVFEDGKWKSSDFQGQVDFACEFAPTERGLPSI